MSARVSRLRRHLTPSAAWGKQKLAAGRAAAAAMMIRRSDGATEPQGDSAATAAAAAAAASSESLVRPAPGKANRRECWSWKPTSVSRLQQAEQAMLSVVETPYSLRDVDAGNGHVIHTLIAGTGPPLVLLHGFGGGVGLWSMQIDALAQHFTVYAIDLPGFGLSSRPRIPWSACGPDQALAWFLSAYHGWRYELGLQRVHLLGHSFGGYLAGKIAADDPDSVDTLLLADPWGVAASNRTVGTAWRLLHGVVTAGGPLGIVRALGPWGPDMMARARQDFVNRFYEAYGESSIATDYLYHLSAQPASGELMFAKLSAPIASPRLPLLPDLPSLPAHLPVVCMYGAQSWMDFRPMHGIRSEMASDVTIFMVPEAGHHVFADNWRVFNACVLHGLGARPQAEVLQPLAVPHDDTFTQRTRNAPRRRYYVPPRRSSSGQVVEQPLPIRTTV